MGTWVIGCTQVGNVAVNNGAGTTGHKRQWEFSPSVTHTEYAESEARPALRSYIPWVHAVKQRVLHAAEPAYE